MSKIDWGFFEQLLANPKVTTGYIWGPPGLGKTFVSSRSGLGDRNVYVITLTPETPAAELRGFWMPQGQEFTWQDGVFIKAMREGARVVINEVSHSSYDVQAILYPVLESPETAALTLPTTETVSPSKGFQVICTDNESPRHLPEALRDRFKVTVEVNEPHPDGLERLQPKYRDIVLSTIHDEDRRVGLRKMLTVQELEEDFGSEQAFSAVFGPDRGRLLWQSIEIAGA